MSRWALLSGTRTGRDAVVSSAVDWASLAPRWSAAASTRISIRDYDPSPISEEEAEALARSMSEFVVFDGARVVVVREAPGDFFTGWLLRVYGKVSSPSALVFVGDRRVPLVEAAVGYAGEAAVLEASALGLATCWIGGGVRRGNVARELGLARHEHAYAVSALGRARTPRQKPHRRKAAPEIAPGMESQEWPDWAVAGVEAARIAPSATNRQPWRFRMEGGHCVIAHTRLDPYVPSKKLDCGIAMLHFEIGARLAGCDGAWTLQRAGGSALGGDVDVARWVPVAR